MCKWVHHFLIKDGNKRVVTYLANWYVYVRVGSWKEFFAVKVMAEKRNEMIAVKIKMRHCILITCVVGKLLLKCELINDGRMRVYKDKNLR